MYLISPFIRHFAMALLAGVLAASVWVNFSPETYFDLVELRMLELPLPGWVAERSVLITPLSLVSDLFMPLFFFFLGKELWEAMILERGALTLSRQPILPVGAFLGSALGAVSVWLVSVAILDPYGDANLRAGWASGIGSDVVLCYVIGRAVFGRAHPALHFLLLLTVTQDIVALGITALTLPFEGLHLAWALLSPLAAVTVWYFCGRHARKDATEVEHVRSNQLWPYALAGVVSWLGFALSGFPPELGLLPIIPVIPHAARSFGIFAQAEVLLHDPLNRLVIALTPAIVVVLFLFGLTRGAIEISSFGPGTQAVLATFWLGKPIGLLAGASLAITFGGGKLPAGMRLSDFVLIAVITATGFTVPVTVFDLTLGGGISAGSARLGLALSLLVAPLIIVLTLVMRRKSAE